MWKKKLISILLAVVMLVPTTMVSAAGNLENLETNNTAEWLSSELYQNKMEVTTSNQQGGLNTLSHRITQAERFTQNGGEEYLNSSYTAFVTTLEAAKEASLRDDLSVADINKQITAITTNERALIKIEDIYPATPLASIDLEMTPTFPDEGLGYSVNETLISFNISEDSLGLSGEISPFDFSLRSNGVLEDGIYSIPVSLWKFGENKFSMGNGAIESLGKLIVKDGVANIHLGFQQLEANLTPTQALRSYLLYFWRIDNYQGGHTPSYQEIPATVISTYENIEDEYGPPTGIEYPKEVSIEIVPYQEFTNVQVFVPVMDSISVGSGTQLARLRLDWSQLHLVQAMPPAPKPKPDKPGLNFQMLKSQIQNASYYLEYQFTQKSFAALTTNKNAGEELELLQRDNLANITQPMIDARTEALKAVQDTMIPVSVSPSDSNKTALNAFVQMASSMDKKLYTLSSYSKLLAALSGARSVLVDPTATQRDIDRMSDTLLSAINDLVVIDDENNANPKEKEKIDTSVLRSLITISDTFNDSKYTETSYNTFLSALTNGRAVLGNANATQASIDHAVLYLQTSISGLKEKSSSSNSGSNKNKNSDDEDEGYYKVNVRLWHASMDKASMGDESMGSTATVKIKGDTYTIRITSNQITVSGITAMLDSLQVKDENGNYKFAKVVNSSDTSRQFEFELHNKDEYVDVKVDPKVSVMGKDPVDARLKFDWDSLKKVSESDWKKSSSNHTENTNNSTKPALDITHSGTGVSVSALAGILESGTTLEVSQITTGADYTKAQTALGKDATKFVLYDITLKKSSASVQPSGQVKLSIPIPSGYDTAKLAIYRINDNGTKTLMVGNVVGSNYVVSTSHFSLYALVESANSPMTSTLWGSGGTSMNLSAAPPNGRSIPYTGDQTPVKLFTEIIAWTGAIAMVYLVLLQKGRKNSDELK